MYINEKPNESGAYSAPQSNRFTGSALLPDDMMTQFLEYNGFINITVEDGVVTGITPNTEAWEAWKATQPDPLDSAREAKIVEMSDACNAAIVAGMDVETTQGTEHFSLQETDQINMTTAYNAVSSGATGYPYHADGQLCRMFSAAEIQAISAASIAHKLYHTTLCNHLMTWARRAATVEELGGITYTADNLPEDLAANMAAVLASAISL